MEVQLIGASLPKFPSDCEDFLTQPLAIRNCPIAPGHVHMDFIYAGIPVGGSLNFSERKPEDVGWFPLEEIVRESFLAPANVRLWCRYCAQHVLLYLQSPLDRKNRDDGK
jgi:hypothetical protein